MPNDFRCDLLLTDARYLSPDQTIVSGKAIAVKDGLILDIVDQSACRYQADTVLSGARLLWMPGLVDGHLHTSQQLLRGRLLDEKPVIWKRVNVPFESRLDEESSRLSAELAAMEMISCGTTGFVDAGGKYPEIYAGVYEKAGLRGRLSVMTNDNPFCPESLRAPSVPAAVERLRSMKNALTGLLNHAYAKKRILERIKSRPNALYALAIFDLDHFKSANDTYGHSFGDQVLVHLAEKLRQSIRGGDIAARAGGDEFLIFLEYKDEVEAVISRIFQSLGGQFEQFPLSVSMGVALTETVSSEYDDLFHAADAALYTVKRGGRGHYRFYDDAMRETLSVISPIEDGETPQK